MRGIPKSAIDVLVTGGCDPQAQRLWAIPRRVLAAVPDHPSTPWEIASKVEWTVGLWEQMDAMNRLLAIQETLAHLHLLQERQRVALVEQGSLSLYELRDDG